MKYFDLHCDTAYEIHRKKSSLLHNCGAVDIERGLKFESYVQNFAIYIEDGLSPDESHKKFLQITQNLIAEIDENSDKITLCRSFLDINRAISCKKIAAVLSIENAAALGDNAANLELAHNLGVCIVSLTWNGENNLASGCQKSGKIKPFGVKILQKMQNLNMILDISHLNREGFWHSFETFEGKIVATHSNVRAICDHSRNLDDNQICAIIKREGLIGLNLYPPFISGEEAAQWCDILKHAEHILKLGGAENLSIGSDFDGADLDKKWDDLAKIPNVFNEFSKEFGVKIAQKIFYENACNFMKKSLI